MPYAQVDQRKPHDEVDTQASGVAQPSLEGHTGTDVSLIPPPVAPDQHLDMRSAVQLLTRLAASQAQCQTLGTSDRVVSTRV